MYDAKSLILFCVLILAINCGPLICTSRHQYQESAVNCHLRCCSWPNRMIILYSTVLSTFAEWEDWQCPAISYDVILNYFVHLLCNTGTTALLSCISIFTVLHSHSPRGWKLNGVFFKVSNQADQFVKPQSMSWQSASHLPHYSEETLQVPPKEGLSYVQQHKVPAWTPLASSF